VLAIDHCVFHDLQHEGIRREDLASGVVFDVVECPSVPDLERTKYEIENTPQQTVAD
jgi:hypothetical protein